MKIIATALLAFGLTVSAIGVAQAGGTVALIDVLERFPNGADLKETIARKIAGSGVAVDDVICSGTRLGRHWTHLGGARQGPYECQVGDEMFVIETAVSYRGETGTVVTDPEAEHLKAVRLVERFSAFTWPASLQ